MRLLEAKCEVFHSSTMDMNEAWSTKCPTAVRSFAISPATFCIQGRYYHFRKIIALGITALLSPYVDHFPEACITHPVFLTHISLVKLMWLLLWFQHVFVSQTDTHANALYWLIFTNVWVDVGKFLLAAIALFFCSLHALIVLQFVMCFQ